MEISDQKSGPPKNPVHPITEIAWAPILQESRQINSTKNKNLILKLMIFYLSFFSENFDFRM